MLKTKITSYNSKRLQKVVNIFWSTCNCWR